MSPRTLSPQDLSGWDVGVESKGSLVKRQQYSLAVKAMDSGTS